MTVSAQRPLLVSEDESLVETVRIAFAADGKPAPEIAIDFSEGRLRLRRAATSLCILHVRNDVDIPKAAQLLAETANTVPTAVLFDRADALTAARFREYGAVECFARPVDLSLLTGLLDSVSRPTRRETTSPPKSSVQRVGSHIEILYLPTTVIGKIFDQVRTVAPQDTTVLLTGETGTGKTRLARIIHELSPRRDEPFVVVDCGSLSGSLIESEVFGHVKGAFTGGDVTRVGKFAEAGQGTLLLDEIDSLPLNLQVKFLRVVEERVFEPVGSNRPSPMRARLVIAANRPLEQEVAAGRFRSDLYFRLNVVRFSLPPLRESRNIIRDLAGKFIREFSVQHKRPAESITTEALHAMEQYPWPGNVRELRNVMQRAVILCPCQKVRIDDLPDSIRRTDTPAVDSNPGPTLAETRRDAEIGSIVHVLRKHNNNRRRAAMELGISRVALYKKLRKYGMMVHKYAKPATGTQPQSISA